MNIKLTTISIVAFLAITCYSPLTAGSYYSGSTSEYEEEPRHNNGSPFSSFLVSDSKGKVPSHINGGKVLVVNNKTKSIVYVAVTNAKGSRISTKAGPGQSSSKSFENSWFGGGEGILRANIKDKRNMQKATTKIDFQGRKNYKNTTTAKGKTYTLRVKWDDRKKGYIATVEEKKARR